MPTIGNASYSIGLTGGIATGKSTAARILGELGLRRVDADQIAREVVMPGAPALAELRQRFGPEIFQDDGILDRAALGRLVFAQPEARRDLEGILHPRIWAALKAAVEEAEREQLETVLEIPLLFESGREQTFDNVWVVWVPQTVQVERLTKRDGFSAQEVAQRLASQWSLEKKVELADFVLDNSGDEEQLRLQIQQGLADWRERRRERQAD